MLSRRFLLTTASAIIALTMTTPTTALADDKLPVVATFSILGDMVERIGGDHVTVKSLVGRNGDAHVFKPSPNDAVLVNEAKILFTNGLGFEGWLERLSESADFAGKVVVATKGIEPIASGHHDDEEDDEHEDNHEEDQDDDQKDDHKDDDHDEHGHHDHGAFDPHAWLSPKIAITYADNVATSLSQANPSKANVFYENRAEYVGELEQLHKEISALVSALPQDKRTIVTSHNAYQYFGREFGLTFLAPQGLSTESEASAKDVAKLITHMKEENVDAVFLENISDSRLLKQIANETGATIGGTLYPGALSEEDGPASTYIDLMRHNATTLTNALGG